MTSTGTQVWTARRLADHSPNVRCSILCSLPARKRRVHWVALLSLLGAVVFLSAPADAQPIQITWQKRLLTIRGERLPAPVTVNYLEAYCRPGSTDRDWKETVIPHQSKLVSANDSHTRIEIEDRLEDGVVVRHVLTAGADEVDFRLTAHNPTSKTSAVDWAQPCVRVGEYTGCGRRDAWEVYPKYIRQSFLFVDGRQAMMPTRPWALKARYTPGQVYCPPHVDRNDVNPRPLSTIVPSNALVGCYSKDRKQLMAIAFVPCQEIFQGVIACLHSDLRIGGLAPGETKQIRGKIYFLAPDVETLLKRYRRDFPRDGFDR